MTFEVTSPEFGRAHARLLGGAPDEATAVHLTVVGATGIRCTSAITIASKPSGRGNHRRFRCPRCAACVAVLVLHGWTVCCSPCAGARTRRQAERTTRVWRHLGGELEDQIVRHIGAGRLTAARRAIAVLRDQDGGRVELLLRDVQVALTALGAVGHAEVAVAESGG